VKHRDYALLDPETLNLNRFIGFESDETEWGCPCSQSESETLCVFMSERGTKWAEKRQWRGRKELLFFVSYRLQPKPSAVPSRKFQAGGHKIGHRCEANQEENVRRTKAVGC